ncbi:hypothetical protein ElyMa_004121400 [Elysia marginata]|uniref:Anoctamin dimerisation domain-containing protein n=1 Tax=Elysia marginata TaxID=1093978 RepID=A0AAV4GCE3_9GAST|nr:hypothetical protein ElyMa_004121400 [Elysia marginata]
MATEGNDEIDIDAEPDSGIKDSRYAVGEEREELLLRKPVDEYEKCTDLGESSQGKITNTYKGYIDFMPAELKDDNFDILLLYHEEDKLKAKKFQEHIERDCKVMVGGSRRNPVVKLEDDCVLPAAHHQRCSTPPVVLPNAICLLSLTTSSYTNTAISMVNAESRFITEYDTSPLDAIPRGMFLGP